jgi:hypothetical protein
MQRHDVRLTRDDRIVLTKWTLAIYGAWAALVLATTTVPAFRKVPPELSASLCSDDSAGEAVAGQTRARRDTGRQLAIGPPSAECPPRSQARAGR